MRFGLYLAAGVALAAIATAAPASAAIEFITYDLGASPASTSNSFSYAGTPAGDVALTISGEYFNFAPNGLNGHTVSDLTATGIYRDATGVGVCNGSETVANGCLTIDTAGPNNTDKNEGLAMAFDSQVLLQSLTVSGFASNATLDLWAVGAGGALTNVYHLNPLGASAPLVIDLSAFNFSGNGWLLTNVGGTDNGYHLDQIKVGRTVADPVQTGGGVPEPATWAMMIMGFFGLGATLRSRRGVTA